MLSPTMKGVPHSQSSKSLNGKSSRPPQTLKITLMGGVMTLIVLYVAFGRTLVGPVVAPCPTAVNSIKVETIAPPLLKAVDPIEEEGEKMEVVVEKKKEYWDPAVPFTMGPKISDWDKQRAVWNSAHPLANVTGSGKSRVLLVSGSPPKPCATNRGTFETLRSFKNKADYCRLHDMELFYNVAHLDPHMTSYWAKLPLLRKLMLSHPEVEWLWWMDSDALITNMDVEVPFASYEKYNLVLSGHDHDVYKKKSWIGINAGIFLIRNCQWSLDLLDAMAVMGPEGPVRDAAGTVLASTLTDRTDFGADDQSAIVYLLISDRKKWGSRTLLETDVGLFGFWVDIVDKFEEMMAEGKSKYKSNGNEGKDNGWPFVTHFAGCKPCGKKPTGEHDMATCMHGLERAFNFADNQVLEFYGYRHTTLSSQAVDRIRNETSDPLALIHGSVAQRH